MDSLNTKFSLWISESRENKWVTHYYHMSTGDTKELISDKQQNHVSINNVAASMAPAFICVVCDS